MKATKSSMANASNKTKIPPITSDAQYGKTVLALNAPKDGTSTPTTSALPSVIYAPNGMPQPVPAPHATTDQSSVKDNALSIPIPASSPTATPSAKLGLQANVPNALTEPSSMLMESAPQ